MSDSATRVTVEDLLTGLVEVTDLPLDEYFIITTGSCHIDGVQMYPTKGTYVVTIKGRKGGVA